jgi:hypothetical protein
MKKVTNIILLLTFSLSSYAQHMAFGAKGGLLVGTQKAKRALLSYHADIFYEGMGKWQGDEVRRRVGCVIQLGYHRRGASYNSGFFGSNPNFIASDLFHNISLSTLLKGHFEVGKFLPYFAAGVRLDITPGEEFHEVINPRDAQGVTPVNFGLWLGGGIEWEPSNVPFGMFIEINISPDLTPQIFFQKGTQVQYPDFYNPGNTRIEQFAQDYKIINLCIEVTFGIKFIMRKNAEPE